jgi:putative FmdB family regulatory protein
VQGNGTPVWTGSAKLTEKGTDASTCGNWTSTTGTAATVGATPGTDAGSWSNDSGQACSNAYTWVYCVEQEAIIRPRNHEIILVEISTRPGRLTAPGLCLSFGARETRMPIYEYACGACGHRFEEWQKMSDPPVTVCPKCKKKKVEKIISATTFTLKGGGWYSDLYGSAKPGTSSSSESSSSSSSSSDSSTKETKSSGKSGGKKAKAGA